MKLKLITLAACTLLAGHALAAAPTASLNRSWTEYTGAKQVGNNKIQDNTSAYWIFEGAGTWMGQAVNSWYVFWDPRKSRQLEGSIDFGHEILFVHDQKSELLDTQAFGKAGINYDYSNKLTGLELRDRNNTSFSDSTLTLNWIASNPGDHIRVMTVVPEPSGYALFGAGLLAMGFMARRRRTN